MHRAAPVELDVREPVWRPDERRPLARERIRKVDSVRGGAETDALLHGANTGVRCSRDCIEGICLPRNAAKIHDYVPHGLAIGGVLL